MFSFGMEAAWRVDPILMSPFVTIELGHGETWRLAYHDRIALMPHDKRRHGLSLERLPGAALWWSDKGICTARHRWRWQPEWQGEHAPWLESIHHSWPYHPPYWLSNAKLLVVEASALAEDPHQRQHQQRSLLRLWRYQRAPLIYLADEPRDGWQFDRLSRLVR